MGSKKDCTNCKYGEGELLRSPIKNCPEWEPKKTIKADGQEMKA